jgi:hypothetical protein
LRLNGARAAGGEDDEVVGIANEHAETAARVGPLLVKDVERDIGEQRRDG